MPVTNFPNRIAQAGTVTVHGVASVVNGAGTVTPTAPDVLTGQTATLAGVHATLNSAVGGTAVNTPFVVGGTIAGSSFVFQLKDNAGGTVAGTATVAYTAFFGIA